MIANPCLDAIWSGRVNLILPAQPTTQTPSEQLFNDPASRKTYWLPDPPGASFPKLQEFWAAMCADVTVYRRLKRIAGPWKPVVGGVSLRSSHAPTPDPARVARTSRQSRSPNWSGASVSACNGGTLTQVVGSWVEPMVDRAGAHSTEDEFRSSVWVGYNGHAAYRDAALPQIGTMQRIVHDSNAGWKTVHWVWFEWWANVRGGETNLFLLPIYIDLDVAAGDTVWSRIDLMPGEPANYPNDAPHPYVARMSICVGRPASDTAPASKVLVMPFVVYPPTLPRQGPIQIMGSKANWIAELPTNIYEGPAFLLPRFGPAAELDPKVTFAHCVAASASDPGAPLLVEHALEVSKRFHMFNDQPSGEASLARIASSLTPRISDTEFSIQVGGNDG